jgi:hypothetical protein
VNALNTKNTSTGGQLTQDNIFNFNDARETI